MDEREYERRRKELDGQEEAAVELIRSAFRAQRNALDLVWMASPENRSRGGLPLLPPPAPEPPRPSVPPELPVPVLPPSPPAVPVKRRWRPGELRTAVQEALTKVPEEFDRGDLVAALGVEPERGSLYRVVEDFVRAGWLERALSGTGRTGTRYRKLDGRREGP